jgi:hypothetical protein
LHDPMLRELYDLKVFARFYVLTHYNADTCAIDFCPM